MGCVDNMGATPAQQELQLLSLSVAQGAGLLAPLQGTDAPLTEQLACHTQNPYAPAQGSFCLQGRDLGCRTMSLASKNCLEEFG